MKGRHVPRPTAPELVRPPRLRPAPARPARCVTSRENGALAVPPTVNRPARPALPWMRHQHGKAEYASVQAKASGSCAARSAGSGGPNRCPSGSHVASSAWRVARPRDRRGRRPEVESTVESARHHRSQFTKAHIHGCFGDSAQGIRLFRVRESIPHPPQPPDPCCVFRPTCASAASPES